MRRRNGLDKVPARSVDARPHGFRQRRARDSAGTLWLYRGTGSTSAPFPTRTEIGGGWNTCNTLVRPA